MKIYNYDLNNIFTYTSVADESPLEPGVYLLPSGATFKEPLKDKKGFCNKFNQDKDKWEYVKLPKIPEVEEATSNELTDADRLQNVKSIAAQLIQQLNILTENNSENIPEYIANLKKITSVI